MTIRVFLIHDPWFWWNVSWDNNYDFDKESIGFYNDHDNAYEDFDDFDNFDNYDDFDDFGNFDNDFENHLTHFASHFWHFLSAEQKLGLIIYFFVNNFQDYDENCGGRGWWRYKEWVW